MGAVAARRPSILTPVVGVLLALLVLSASWAGTAALTGVVVIAALAVCLELSALLAQNEIRTRRLTMAAMAAALPLITHRWGEGALGASLGIASAVVLGSFLVGGLKQGVLLAAATTAFGGIYAGLPASYTVLLRDVQGGRKLILVLALMLAGYHLGRFVGTRRLRTPHILPEVPASLTWSGLGLGLAGALLGAVPAAALVGLGFSPVVVIVIGSIVGAAAACGDLAAALLLNRLGVKEREASVPGLGGLIAVSAAAMFAAPACLYALRLYLT